MDTLEICTAQESALPLKRHLSCPLTPREICYKTGKSSLRLSKHLSCLLTPWAMLQNTNVCSSTQQKHRLYGNALNNLLEPNKCALR